MSNEGRIYLPALTLPAAARLLSKAGRWVILLEQIEMDVVADASQNGDGTTNLISYAAWLCAAFFIQMYPQPASPFSTGLNNEAK